MASPTKYPKLQEIDVQELMHCALKYMEWRDLSGDIVLDVGCGDGNNSTRQIATLFPKVKKIIAIDIISSTIEMAKQNHPHRKIEYCVANIEDSSTLTPWLSKMSKVISVNCFTYLLDQALAFENVYKLLIPGGEAAFLFGLQSCHFDTFTDIIQQTKWKHYFTSVKAVVPESHTKKFDASHYLVMLKKIGFQVVLCQVEERSYMYQSDTECKKSLAKCLLADYIPSNQREEFKEAIFETFLKHNPRGSREQPLLHYQVLSVLVKKLETPL